MPCYVIAAICIFLSARRLTRSSSASFVGTLLFIFNPSVLYLQTTPLSETVCMATFTLTAYFFICWAEEGKLSQLIFTAICAFLGTLARYDGWALFLGLFCCIALIGWMKRQRLLHIQANLITFSILGGLGIGLWFLWNKLIFGDPLFFQKGLYSSQAQQSLELTSGKLFSYHNVWQSIRFYMITSGLTVGLALLALMVLGVFLFVSRYKFTPLTIAGLLFLIPFPFYIAALYSGQAIIWVPGANPPDAHLYMYNVRYGAQTVAPAAFFVAFVVERLRHVSTQRFHSLGHLLILGVITFQTVLITIQGIIPLQDGQYVAACGPQKTIVQYLAQHYNGGKILQDVYASQFDVSDAGINYANVIYEGSSLFWTKALKNPANAAEWVVVTPHTAIDPIAQRVQSNPAFLSLFTLAIRQSDGILLYHRIGEPPLPTRPLPPVWRGSHPPCL